MKNQVTQSNQLIDDKIVKTTNIDNEYVLALQQRSSEENAHFPLFDQSIGCKLYKGSRELLQNDRTQRFDATIDLFPKYVWCALELYN